METISVALALPSGDVSSLAEVVDAHPLLETCGVARTLEDLWRLLHRFRPDMLLISTQLLLDLEDEAPGFHDQDRLGLIPAFLVTGTEPWTGYEGLSNLFRGPFAFCGTIDPAKADPEDLYIRLREKAELLRGTAFREPFGNPGKKPSAPGLVILAGGKGGVGNSLLASSLAASFAVRERRVLLVDLDRERSQLSMFKPEGTGKSLLDLLPLAEDISWEMARVSLYRHPAGFYLLPFGHQRGKEARRASRLPSFFFRNLAFLFDTVVVDLPGHLAEEFLPLLLPCRALSVVTMSDALSARSARVLSSTVRGFGIDPRVLRLIINRHGNSSTLQPHEISRAIGIENTCTVPDDQRSGLDFAELGRLPRPDSSLGKAVSRLAGWLIGETEPYPVGEQRLRLFPGTGKKKSSYLPSTAGR